MPKYFFHVVNGEFVPDLEGTECATTEDIKAQAVVVAGQMLKDQGIQLWRTRRYDMFVCDEQNKTHLKLSVQAEDLTGDLE
jgi:hypothetical protein